MRRSCIGVSTLFTFAIVSVIDAAEVHADEQAQAAASPPTGAVEVKEADAKASPPPKAPPRTYVSLGAGASSGSQGAIICAEVAPLHFLSVSGCGNGSGFLHHDAAPDLSHWRLNATIASLRVNAFWLQPRVQLGFAEVQVGQDTPGFQFTRTNETRTSTSGAEGGVSLRGLYPIKSSGFELISELGLSVGYFPHAPMLIRPQSTFIPSASLTVGLGF